MLTNTVLTALKKYFTDNVAYAKFKVKNIYYQVPIRNTEILADGRIVFTFMIDQSVAGNVITEVQLLDKNNILLASKPENITRKDVLDGIMYRFVITITEG